jgi:hypothetical protein
MGESIEFEGKVADLLLDTEGFIRSNVKNFNRTIFLEKTDGEALRLYVITTKENSVILDETLDGLKSGDTLRFRIPADGKWLQLAVNGSAIEPLEFHTGKSFFRSMNLSSAALEYNDTHVKFLAPPPAPSEPASAEPETTASAVTNEPTTAAQGAVTTQTKADTTIPAPANISQLLQAQNTLLSQIRLLVVVCLALLILLAVCLVMLALLLRSKTQADDTPDGLLAQAFTAQAPELPEDEPEQGFQITLPEAEPQPAAAPAQPIPGVETVISRAYEGRFGDLRDFYLNSSRAYLVDADREVAAKIREGQRIELELQPAPEPDIAMYIALHDSRTDNWLLYLNPYRYNKRNDTFSLSSGGNSAFLYTCCFSFNIVDVFSKEIQQVHPALLQMQSNGVLVLNRQGSIMLSS